MNSLSQKGQQQATSTSFEDLVSEAFEYGLRVKVLSVKYVDLEHYRIEFSWGTGNPDVEVFTAGYVLILIKELLEEKGKGAQQQ